MSEKKCIKCEKTYNSALPVCPYCGTVDRGRAMQIFDLEIKARSNPKLGILCMRCNSIFPNDQTRCPFCCTTINHGNTKSISGKSKAELDKLVTPIGAYCKGKQIPSAKIKTINQKVQLVPCSCCGRKLSPKAEVCPSCGNPTGVHVCPKCGSINTTPISGMSKATSIALWGAFSANKVMSKFKCKDCGHKF